MTSPDRTASPEIKEASAAAPIAKTAVVRSADNPFGLTPELKTKVKNYIKKTEDKKAMKNEENMRAKATQAMDSLDRVATQQKPQPIQQPSLEEIMGEKKEMPAKVKAKLDEIEKGLKPFKF